MYDLFLVRVIGCFVLTKSSGLYAILLNSIPLNNFVSHKELNKTINFLLEDEIVSMRGANITLDGGYTLW